MQTITWDASQSAANKDKDGKELEKKVYEGSAKIMLPNYINKLKLIKECNFKTKNDGAVEIGMDQLDSVIILAEKAKPYVKEVEIKHLESGKIAKSYDDLLENWEFEEIISEVCALPLSGGKVGNS